MPLRYTLQNRSWVYAQKCTNLKPKQLKYSKYRGMQYRNTNRIGRKKEACTCLRTQNTN